jgi:hypothetical protein
MIWQKNKLLLQKNRIIMATKKIKTKYNYDNIEQFKEELAIVRLNSKYGFIDKKGNEVIPPIYDNAKPFNNGKAEVQFMGKWRLIDCDGKVIAKFDVIESCKKAVVSEAKVAVCETKATVSETNAVVSEKMLNKPEENEVLPKKEAEIVMRIYNFIPFKSKRKWGLKDSSGKEILPPIYNSFREFDNLILVKYGRKWGLVDLSGNEIIAPKLDEISKHGSYYLVKIEGKWGLTDKSGNEIVEPKFYNSSSIFKKSVNGFIDNTGKKVQFEWD